MQRLEVSGAVRPIYGPYRTEAVNMLRCGSTYFHLGTGWMPVRFTRGHWTFGGKIVAGSHRVGGCSGCDVVGGGFARREKILSLLGMECRFFWSSSIYPLRPQLYRSPFYIR